MYWAILSTCCLKDENTTTSKMVGVEMVDLKLGSKTYTLTGSRATSDRSITNSGEKCNRYNDNLTSHRNHICGLKIEM